MLAKKGKKLTQPSSYKWCHFHGEVILQCVRWHCKSGISYRDLEEMMVERGLEIDHTTSDYMPGNFVGSGL